MNGIIGTWSTAHLVFASVAAYLAMAHATAFFIGMVDSNFNDDCVGWFALLWPLTIIAEVVFCIYAGCWFLWNLSSTIAMCLGVLIKSQKSKFWRMVYWGGRIMVYYIFHPYKSGAGISKWMVNRLCQRKRQKSREKEEE